MNKTMKTALILPFLMAIPALAMAAPNFSATPVEIIGMQPAAPDAGVDAALNDSMEKPAPEKPKHKKAPKLAPVADAAPAETAGGEPLADIPTAQAKDYTIKPGDVLQVTVWKEENLDREVLVLPDGTIDFPLIGSFSVQGMTPAQVQATIKNKLHSMIPGASVAVLVKATLGHTASIIGQVNKPGEIIMAHNVTVMQALSQAGGLTPYASEGSIIILRTVDGKQSAIDFPYKDIISGRNLEKNITLKPGDVIVVPTASLF